MHITILFAYTGPVTTTPVLLGGFVMIRLQKEDFLMRQIKRYANKFLTHMQLKVYKDQFMRRNNGPAIEHVSRIDKSFDFKKLYKYMSPIFLIRI